MKLFNMYEIVKKIAVGIGLLALTATLQAAPFVATTGTTNAVLVESGPGDLTSIMIFNPSASNALVYLYDSPTNNYQWTNAGFSNYVTTVVTYTNIYTNYFGVITTNSYPAETNSISVSAASTNAQRIVGIMVVPSTSSASLTNLGFLTQGLYITNYNTGNTNLAVVANIARRY